VVWEPCCAGLNPILHSFQKAVRQFKLLLQAVHKPPLLDVEDQ